MLITIFIPIIVVLLVLLAAAIKILREYQRGVVFTLGRFTGVKGPGLIILIPFVQQMLRVDLRTVVHDVPSQDVISKDNVSVRVNAVLYFRVSVADVYFQRFAAGSSDQGEWTVMPRREIGNGSLRGFGKTDDDTRR